MLEVDSPPVLAWRRRHPRSGWFVGMVNFAEHPVSVDTRRLDGLGELDTVLSSDGPLDVHEGRGAAARAGLLVAHRAVRSGVDNPG